MHFFLCFSPHLLLLPLSVDVVDGRGNLFLILGFVPPAPTAALSLPVAGAAAVSAVVGRRVGPRAAAPAAARGPVDGEGRVEELLAVAVVGGCRGWKREKNESHLYRGGQKIDPRLR